MAKGFKGMPGMGGGGMNNLLQQAQRMQQAAERAQEEIKHSTFEATAGGGVVKVIVGGDHEIKSLEIDRSAVDPEDVEMLQDMIIAACNEAQRKLEEFSSAKMGQVTGGMKMPF
ncbi:MAG: YbaB/EbfC family nucleoid-associated protein [Clostridiaceae bacterium]|nr:YbaB/EbfC family nucleoid-associated protein [Clostridiaceae bacterium]